MDPQHKRKPVYGRCGITGPREKKEIGMHSLRGGTEAGTHTVSFFGPDEVLEITHRASSRQIFVNGALQAEWITGAKRPRSSNTASSASLSPVTPDSRGVPVVRT